MGSIRGVTSFAVQSQGTTGRSLLPQYRRGTIHGPVWGTRLVKRLSGFLPLKDSSHESAAAEGHTGRTGTSFEAATVLAQYLPFDILTDTDTLVYNKIRSVGWRDEETMLDHLLMSPECYGCSRICKVCTLGGHGSNLGLCQPTRWRSRSAERTDCLTY